VFKYKKKLRVNREKEIELECKNWIDRNTLINIWIVRLINLNVIIWIFELEKKKN